MNSAVSYPNYQAVFSLGLGWRSRSQIQAFEKITSVSRLGKISLSYRWIGRYTHSSCLSHAQNKREWERTRTNRRSFRWTLRGVPTSYYYILEKKFLLFHPAGDQVSYITIRTIYQRPSSYRPPSLIWDTRICNWCELRLTYKMIRNQTPETCKRPKKISVKILWKMGQERIRPIFHIIFVSGEKAFSAYRW